MIIPLSQYGYILAIAIVAVKFKECRFWLIWGWVITFLEPVFSFQEELSSFQIKQY